MLHNFRSRAATVHIKNIGADFFSHFRRHAHPLRLAAEDLNRKRPLVFVEAHLALRLWIVARESFDRNKLRYGETDPTACFQQTAKGNVGHTRHRRKHQRRIDLDVADPEGLDIAHEKTT